MTENYSYGSITAQHTYKEPTHGKRNTLNQGTLFINLPGKSSRKPSNVSSSVIIFSVQFCAIGRLHLRRPMISRPYFRVLSLTN